jgi:sugar phosphate isomerase/epimerase
MILGARAHDFGKNTVKELAAKIAAKGFKSIQLALNKAFIDFNSDFSDINEEYANYIRDTFARNNISIVVLGCYVNLIHPDPEQRNEFINRYKIHFKYAKEFGCNIVGTETGSLNGDYSYNSENHGEKAFQILKEVLSELVEEAEKYSTFLCIEGVAHHVINTPERLSLMLDNIKSKYLRIIFDPRNYLTAQNYLESDEIIKKSFVLFPDKIDIVHVKDFTIQNKEFVKAAIGKGLLNYPLLIDLIKKHRPGVHLLMEEVDLSTLDESLAYLKKFL